MQMQMYSAGLPVILSQYRLHQPRLSTFAAPSMLVFPFYVPLGLEDISWTLIMA